MRHRWLWLGIFTVALAIRAGIAWRGSATGLATDNPDSRQYTRSAINLVDHGVFSSAATAPFKPDAIRTPGYPLLLSGLYLITRDLSLVVPVQITLDLLVMLLIALLTESLFGERAALVAAAAYAVDWTAAVYANMILSETLCALCLIAAFWLLLRALQRQRPAWFFALGACLGAAVLVRPFFLLLPPVLLLALLVRFGRHGVIPTASVAIGLVLVVGPWSARNYHHWRSTMISSLGGAAAYYFDVAPLLAAESHISVHRATADLRRQSGPMLLPEPENAFRNSAVLFKMAAQAFLARPLLTLALWAKGSLKTLLQPTSGGVWPWTAHQQPAWRVRVFTLFFFWLATVALALVGVRWGLKSQPDATVALIAVVGVTLVTASLQGYARFRVPTDWVVCVLAGAALSVRAKRAVLGKRSPGTS